MKERTKEKEKCKCLNDYSLKQHFLTYNISFLSQFFIFC